jgi:dTDP-4-dehydrorhamnose 3,5-epimerase
LIFTGTRVPGVVLIDPEPNEDERGFFARTYDAGEFAARGLCTTWPQASVSHNRRRGTLRGLHLQVAPHEESKLVRCTLGAIFDVVVDLRRESPAYTRSVTVELSADNRRQVHIPPGCAHGFQALTDGAEIAYWISAAYQPEAARGARYDDPLFAIEWPLPPTVMSQRDRDFPDWVR